MNLEKHPKRPSPHGEEGCGSETLTIFIIFLSISTIKQTCAQRTNIPICVTITKYLIWPNQQTNVIPVGSSQQGYLKSSGFSIVQDVALRFPPTSSESIVCDRNNVGAIYYYSTTTGDRFKCCMRISTNPAVYQWIDCSGGGGVPPGEVWKVDPQTGNIYWEKGGIRMIEIGGQ